MGENIEFSRPDGQTCPGYLATPAGGEDAPGLVVIQEWWGLNDQIKKTADRFAEAGFRALVPDLYRGKVTTDADEANHMMTNLDWAGAVTDIAGAVGHLKAGGKKAGVLGFCMGGALTILAGINVEAADAGVCFYGIPPAEAADPSKISMPLMCHFATEDDWCNAAAVDGLEASLKAGNVSFELFRYEGTQHAFFNEARPEVFDADAAQQSFDRSIAFLKTQLG